MEAKEFIKDYDVLIFDLGKTIMFEGDRFGNSQDYEDTYKSFGGCLINNEDLHELISHIYSTLLVISRTPYYVDIMPTVREFLDKDMHFDMYDSHEKDLLEQVFAYHECGTVPQECRQTLKKLAKTHRLGIISNVWCSSKYFFNKLKEDEVFELFDNIIISSDHGTVKPSRKIFAMAAENFKRPPAEIVYIGDNYGRDIVGSANAGMRNIWVNRNGYHPGDIKPDFEIKHIKELV